MARGPLEKDTCRDYVLPRLKAAGWSKDQILEQFPITDGRIISVGKLCLCTNRTCENRHRPLYRFHDLRHTCAALLIAQGAHPKEIQERLGHSTITLTFDRYGHLLPSLDERLRDGLDQMIRQAHLTER